MEGVNKLLDNVKNVTKARNDAGLADALGVTRQAVSNWRRGVAAPDPVICAKIAQITNEPLARVLGIVGEARARSTAEKAVWHKLASAAAIVLLGLAAYAKPSPSSATPARSNGADIYIMRSGRQRRRVNYLRRLTRPLPLWSATA